MSEIKNQINELKYNDYEIKNEILSLKAEIIDIKNLLNQSIQLIKSQKELNSKKNINNNYDSPFDENNNIYENDSDYDKENNIINIYLSNDNLIGYNNLNQTIKSEVENQSNLTDRTVTISMDGKDYIITINDKTTLNEFKNNAKHFFKIDKNVKIHYFNNFAIKKIISNEIDFKNSLIENVLNIILQKKNQL